MKAYLNCGWISARVTACITGATAKRLLFYWVAAASVDNQLTSPLRLNVGNDLNWRLECCSHNASRPKQLEILAASLVVSGSFSRRLHHPVSGRRICLLGSAGCFRRDSSLAAVALDDAWSSVRPPRLDSAAEGI